MSNLIVKIFMFDVNDLMVKKFILSCQGFDKLFILNDVKDLIVKSFILFDVSDFMLIIFILIFYANNLVVKIK